METIIVKPKKCGRGKRGTFFFKTKKDKERNLYGTNQRRDLDSIERGARQAADFLKGKIKLRDAQQVLDEL